jgi:hypothetical protein
MMYFCYRILSVYFFNQLIHIKKNLYWKQNWIDNLVEHIAHVQMKLIGFLVAKTEFDTLNMESRCLKWGNEVSDSKNAIFCRSTLLWPN